MGYRCGVSTPARRYVSLTGVICADLPAWRYFTFDDVHAGTGLVLELFAGMPSRIPCVRERRFKFARCFNADDPAPVEYEMHDLLKDPCRG